MRPVMGEGPSRPAKKKTKKKKKKKKKKTKKKKKKKNEKTTDTVKVWQINTLQCDNYQVRMFLHIIIDRGQINMSHFRFCSYFIVEITLKYLLFRATNTTTIYLLLQ